MKRPRWPLLSVPVLMDPSPFCTNTLCCLWIPACSKLDFKPALGETVQRHWSWLCEHSFCPGIWVFIALVHSDQATLDIGELSLSVFSLISTVIQSALAEGASAFLWRSALLMNLFSEVLFLCLHHTLLWIKFRGDMTLLKCSMERWWTRMRIPPFKKCR